MLDVLYKWLRFKVRSVLHLHMLVAWLVGTLSGSTSTPHGHKFDTHAIGCRQRVDAISSCARPGRRWFLMMLAQCLVKLLKLLRHILGV